jgi:Fe-S-cluster containining protein
MTLPIMTLVREECWSCRACGKCCRGSVVPLHDDDLRRLQTQQWDQYPEFRSRPYIVRRSLFSRRFKLAQRSDGTCVFLDEDGRCGIHHQFGFDQKPLVCRMYPLQVVPLEKTAILTLRRSCSEAAAGGGVGISAYLEEVRRYVRIRPQLAESTAPPAVSKGQIRPWPDFIMIAEALEELFCDPKFPLARKLVQGLWLCNLLEQCRLKNIRTEELRDLVNFFAKAAPLNVEDTFRTPEPPGAITGVLFRQAVALYLRLHPYFGPDESWQGRLLLWISAFAFTRGTGPIPALHPAFPERSFADVERQVLSPLTGDVQGLLNDYFESNLCSKQYAVVSRPGWPLLDRFRALAFAFPVACWMLRYFSGHEPPTKETAVAVITTIDRGQGYAPLIGAHHRQRIARLKSIQALEKLIVWYAR